MNLALGLDLGTTSLSAIALREDGSVAASITRDNDAALSGRPPHHAEQSPQRHLESAVDVLAELAAELDGTPRCLGMTGQMHGGMLIDENRAPVSPLITWQDRRAAIPDNKGRTLLDEFRSRCPDDEIAKTGCTPSAGYLGVTLFALRRRNEWPPAAKRAVLLADWIAAELCGAEPVTDRSNAASTGLYDLQDDCWSEPLIAAAELDASLLPEVRESGDVVGALRSDLAARTGLPAGLPVCNAIGDNQAAVLGSVPAGDASVQINIGTGGQINWPIPQFHRVAGMETRYLPLGRFMLVGAGTAGGAAYAWVNDAVTDWLTAFGCNVDRETLYQRLGELAAAVPDDGDGLTCEPFFRGTRRAPEARGVFAGIDERNFTPGHVARAVLNGVAAALFAFYEEAGAHARSGIRKNSDESDTAGKNRNSHEFRYTRIIGSGNGLRKNPLLAAAIARRFDRDVWLPEHCEEAAYGAALLAGSQTGVWPSLEAAGQCIRLRRA